MADNTEIVHEIVMGDGKKIKVKKSDWDAMSDKYINKFGDGRLLMTDKKGNKGYIPLSSYNDALEKGMHATRMGADLNQYSRVMSNYKDKYISQGNDNMSRPASTQQTRQTQAQPKGQQVQVAQQRPVVSRQQTVQSTQAKQVQAQQAQQTQTRQATQRQQAQSKVSGASGVLKTAKLRRGGKDYEIPWQEINAEGGLGKYITNHDSKEAPIRVYMRDANGKLFHVDARQVNNYRGKGYKFEVGRAKRWQPTASEKAAKMADIQEMADNAKDVIGGYQRSMNRAAGLPEDWNWDDKTNYEQGHAAIEQEKNRRKAAEFGAQLQGIDTKPMGLFSGGGLSGANGGEKTSSQQEQSPFAMANAKSPEVNRVVMKDGKPTVEWVLPDGSVTTDIMEADKAEYYARKERGRRSGEAELRNMGLNPLNPMAVNTQRAWKNLANEWGEKQAAQIREMLGNSDATKQAWEITDQLYKEADGEMKAAAKRNAEKMMAEDKGVLGGMETKTSNVGVFAGRNFADYLNIYDMMDMSDKVWGMMDEDKKDELRKTAREQGYTSAEDIERYARAKSDEVVYDYAKRRNAPKNVLDLFVRNVINANTVTSLAKGLMRMGTKKQGDLDAKEMAYAEYGKEHPGWNIAGNVFGVGFDPVTWVSGWVGGKAGKFALSLYGRRLEKMYQLAKGAGKGIAAAKGTGKLLAGVAGGAGNFATFEAGGEIKQQIEKGGAVGDDGRVHGYSAGRVIGAAAKGAGMGAVMGAGSHYISKGAAKAISKTDNVWGKAGIASGRTLTNTLWSATVLSIPEWINGEMSPMDVWLENIGTMGGFGLMHGIKAAPRVIRELAPVKNPTTAAERLHNRTSFMERVDNVLSAGTVDTWLTQSDYAELMANGYGDFYDLFKARDKEGILDTKTKYSTDPRTQEYKDAFGRMEEFVKDERVSQRLRSKMYSMLTGRGLPISGYTRAEYGETPEGEGYVATYTPEGRLVTFDLYKDDVQAAGAADKLSETCQRVAVGYAEDFANGVADNELLIESLIRVYAKRNPEETRMDEELVRSLVDEYRAMIAKPKDELTTEERVYLDMMNSEIIANHRKQERRRPEGARELIRDNYGVDVDAALRKGYFKQTERETKAIEEYVRLLMPKEEEFNRMYDGEFITYTDEGKPDDPDNPNGNNGGGEAPEDDVPPVEPKPVEPTDPNGGNERNEGNVGNDGNDGNERGASPEDGVPPADIQPEQTKVSARMQAAIDEYNAALEELTRFVGEENADKIINEFGAKEYLDYLTGEGVSSRADYDALKRLIAADEAIDQINRDTERDLGYQNGKKAAEQMTDEELAAELMKASEEANDSMPTEFNLGYLNAISDTLRDRQKQAAEGNWTPKEGEPNEPKEETGDNNEPKDDAPADDASNEGNERNVGNVGNDRNERNERNVGNGELPGNPPVEDAPAGEGDAPTGEGITPTGEGDAPTGEGELGNKGADDSALSLVPVGEDGEPNFLAVDTETGWDALVEMIGNEDGAKAIAEAQADQAGKDVAAIRKREPQKGKVKLTGSVTAMAEAYKNAEKKYEEDHAAWESEMSAAVAKHERWQALAAEPEARRKAAEEAEAKRKAEEEERVRAEEVERRRKAAEAERIRIAEEKERKRIEAEERKRIAKGDRELAKAYDRCKKYPEALEILRDDQPHDIYEAVSVALSGHKILLNDDGVRRGYKYETGLGEGERKRFFRMFATRENGGISIARLAEDIVQEICDVNGIRYDNNDARGVIIEMLASSDGPSDIYNYIRNRRIEQANSIVDRYEYEEECSLREDFWYEMHMTPEEWDAYNDYREEELKELDNHFRDFDFSEHYANIAERIEKEYANGKDINRKGESDAEGGGDQSNVPVGTLVRGEGIPKEGSSGEVSTGSENVKKDLLRSSDHGERLDREATGEGPDVGIGQAERGNSGALPERVTEDGDVNGLAWGKDRVSHDNYGREIVHRNMYYNGEVIGVYYGKESGNLLRDGVEEYAISVPGLETKEDLMLPLYDADGKDVREGGKEAPYKLDAGWISFNTKEEAVDFYKRNKDAIDKFNEAADTDVSAEMRTLAKSLLDDKSLVEYANGVVYSKPGEDVGNGAKMGAELGKLVCERLLKDNPDLNTKELFKVGNLFLGELLSPLNSESKGKQVRTSMVMPYYDALKERPETTLNRRLEMLKEKGITPEGNPLNIDELADAYLNANREYNESYIDFLEDKIDENEWRRKGDELNKKVQSARKELEDAILTLSDGELKSIGATKDIEDVVNSILKDREENNRLADDFERLIEMQGEIVGKSKVKYKLADIIDKKTDTKQLLGIYHDGGYAVASDKIVLVADKREYDEANDGKIVGLDGSVVDGQYPTWRAVMPKQISEIGLDPKGMLDFITGVKAKAKSINPKQKRSELHVLINIGGNIQSYSLNQLEKFCNAAVSLDAKLYIMQREDSLVPLYAEGKNGFALIMPTQRPHGTLTNNIGVYAYNKPVAKGEPKASVWAGDAEGGKRLSEGDGDIGNNSGDGVEDYAEMDEYVPQTWDENSSLRDVEARLKLLEDAFYYPWEALGKKIFPDAEQLHAEAKALADKYGGRDRIPKEEEDALTAKYADHLARQDAMREEIYSLRELRDRLEAKMSREKLEEIERQKKADQLAKYNGYLRGRGNLQASSIDRNLSKKKRIDGEVATVAEFIERWLADGSLNVSTYNYRPQINRRRWNRMSSQEQAAWEASHNKPKTEYLVNDYDLGKTAYDYARWLLSQKNKGKLGGGKPQERSIVEENGADVVKEQKAVGTGDVSPREVALRDSLIGVLRDAGVEVVTDVAEGQRVLDKANGDAKVQAKIGGNEQKLRQHKVYHGSGADFDAFDNNHMSEGEGAQAYGWGTYVTEVEAIGRNYAIVNNNSLRKSKLESDIYRLKEALPFRRGEAKREGEEELKRLEEELSKFNDDWRSVLYTVEIPDDTGSNYLHWDKPVGREKSDKISKALYDRILREDKDGSYENEYSRAALRRELDSLSGIDGKDLYDTISAYLGGDKAASEFLRDNGFVGVSYPSQYRSGGRKDAARNYVVFDEKDMEITDKVKFFRRGDGEAYGYTVDGKIYIDPRIATAETPIHEYAHLWSAFMRKANPKAWGDIVKLMKDCTDIWDQVTRDYPELKTEDDIAEEVLTHYSGRRGAERLRAEMQRAMESAGKDVKKQTMIASMFEGVRRALSRFWRGVTDLFHIRFTSAEDVADRVLADMLNGFNPVEAGKKLGERAGVAEVKDSFERYRGRNPRARQLSLFDGDSKVQPEARQLSLFDDAEVDGSGRIIEPERQMEMDRNAEKVNSSLDEFTDEYAEYLRMLDETEGSEDFVPEDAEARVMDLRDKLVEDMMEYHRSAGMGEAEARKRSWELVNQTMTDINVALLRKGKSGNIELLPEDTIKVERMNESEEAKEWLPELGEGEFCYMKRKFSEDKSFVFSAPEHIESMDDVAYIFKQLEKYSVEHSFLALVKDGKATVVHLGMGNATTTVVNMAAARAALDKFDPDMVYFVHNHPSGVLTASRPDMDSLQTLRDMTKGKVECEALIIDTLSGKYAQFGLDGHSRILDLPNGFDNEVEVKVQAHDKMEYAPDFTPDKNEQTNSAGDIVKYVSSLRVGVGDKVGVLVMNQQNHILANLYLPMEEDMRVLGDDIAGKVVRFGGNRVIVYTNNGQMLEVGKALEDAIKMRSGKSVLLLDVLRLKKDGDYQALSESVFEADEGYGNNAHDIAISDRVAQREYLLSDNYVSSLKGEEFDKSDKPLTERVAQFYTQKFDGKVERKGLGTVILDKRGVKDSLSHGIGRNKAAAFAAVPDIICNGVLIDQKENWKNRKYDSYTIAAPIEIAGEGFVGVAIVTRGHGTNANRFYLHEVVLQKNLLDESIKTDTKADSHRGDVAKVLKEIVTAKGNGENVIENSARYRIGADEAAAKSGDGYNGDALGSASTSEEEMRGEAERLSVELNTPVRIITDAEGAASLPTVRQRRAKGFWSEKGGIVVVLPNHKDVADVAGTVLHEIVGHDGLRVLFPEKEKLDNALDELYGVSHDKIRTEIDSRTDKIFQNEVERIMERKRKEHVAKGEDVSANYLKDLAEAHAEAEKKRAEMRREATEEYGAGLADRIGEDGFKRMDAEEATF